MKCVTSGGERLNNGTPLTALFFLYILGLVDCLAALLRLSAKTIGVEMYELIILSLLMRFPLHGYLIAQIANDTIGPWAKISNGTLYPLLTRLERQGLITRVNEEQSVAQTEQQARTFLITDEGRKRFYQVMMDTSSNIGDYQRQFHLKVPYLDLLPSRERQHLLNHYINYCQACLLHIKTHAENLEHELVGEKGMYPLFKTLALQVMQERARLWKAEVEWTGHLGEVLSAVSEQAALLE
jgi:DNA-binding PadR family transcriptional regulator